MSYNLDDINKSPALRAFNASMDIIDSEWNKRLQPESEMAECMICNRDFLVEKEDEEVFYVCEKCAEEEG